MLDGHCLGCDTGVKFFRWKEKPFGPKGRIGKPIAQG